LQVFAEGRYTARQLARVIPEEVVMDSVLFEKVCSTRQRATRPARKAVRASR
jgi:hypothetical protein